MALPVKLLMPLLGAALMLAPAAAPAQSRNNGWDYSFARNDGSLELYWAAKKGIGVKSWNVRWLARNNRDHAVRLDTLRVGYACPGQGTVVKTHYFMKTVTAHGEASHSPDIVCQNGRPTAATIMSIDYGKGSAPPTKTVATRVTAPCDLVPGATRTGQNPTYKVEHLRGDWRNLRITMDNGSRLTLNLRQYIMQDTREIVPPGSKPPQVLDQARITADILQFACAAPHKPTFDDRMMGATRQGTILFFEVVGKALCTFNPDLDICRPPPPRSKGSDGTRG